MSSCCLLSSLGIIVPEAPLATLTPRTIALHRTLPWVGDRISSKQIIPNAEKPLAFQFQHHRGQCHHSTPTIHCTSGLSAALYLALVDVCRLQDLKMDVIVRRDPQVEAKGEEYALERIKLVPTKLERNRSVPRAFYPTTSMSWSTTASDVRKIFY